MTQDLIQPVIGLFGVVGYLSVGAAINGALRFQGDNAVWWLFAWPLFTVIGLLVAPFALPVGAWWLAGKARDAFDARMRAHREGEGR